MPIYRGPDGKIIEESTRTVASTSAKPNTGEIDGKTRKLSSKPVPPPTSNDTPVDEVSDISGETKLYKKTTAQTTQLDDPVVGWLVVVDGFGKGASFPLGFGTNSIGRGADQRVPLTFGDKQISRQDHSILTYDQKNNDFYIQGGGGRNLTYLNEKAVLTPTLLSNKDVILIGETSLKFVAFCSTDFNWQTQ